MPNTKSAERRVRANERKRLKNRRVTSGLHRLEKNFRQSLAAGKKEDATKALREVISAFDKGVKSGVIHRATADRKKGRLTLALNRSK